MSWTETQLSKVFSCLFACSIDRLCLNERKFFEFSQNSLKSACFDSRLKQVKVDCFSLEFGGLAFMIQEWSYQLSLGGGLAFIPFISKPHLLA